MDVVRYKKLLALLSSGEAIFARERVGLHADPDDDGGNGLSDDTDANRVHARPVHALGLENIVDLMSEVVFPDCAQGMVADDPKLLERKVRLGAGGWLPSIGACTSHKDRLGVQPVIIVLGLEIGEREAKSSGALRGIRLATQDSRVRPRRREAPELIASRGIHTERGTRGRW